MKGDRRTGGRARWAWALLAYGAVALAIAGIFIPGLPTTPFVLLAAWAAARGSERLHRWIVRHPRLGPILADWRDQRAISTGAKLVAVVLLAASWTLMFLRALAPWLLGALGLLFLALTTFVLTRPSPQRPGRSG